MAIANEEFLKANVVVVGTNLVPGQEELASLRERLGAEVVVAGSLLVQGLADGSTDQGRVLSIPKYRVEIQASRVRTVIEREYPNGGEGLDQIADVYAAAEGPDHEGVTSFGLNFEYVFEQDSGKPAGLYLAERVVNRKSVAEASGREVVSSAVQMVLQGTNSQRWMVTLEPRFNDESTERVFVNLNVHYGEAAAPPREELRKDLSEVMDELRGFVMKLDRTGG